jgi:hypothetical protein
MTRYTMAADALLNFNVAVQTVDGKREGTIDSELVLLEIQGFAGNFGDVAEGQAQIEPGSPGAVATVRIGHKGRPELGHVDIEMQLAAGAPDTIEALLVENVAAPVNREPGREL